MAEGTLLGRYATFSFTALWARLGHSMDSAMQASGKVPPVPEGALSASEHATLAAQLRPRLEAFETLRQQTLATVDRRARWWVPLAGIGTFVAVLAGGWGVTSALLFGLLAALAGWFVAIGSRAERYQAAVKQGVGDTVSVQLLGFAHEVAPETDLAHVRGWHLFPELQSARSLDRLTGDWHGREVILAEMAIAYAPGRGAQSPRRSEMADAVLPVSVVETDWPAARGAMLALTPKDAPRRLLLAPQGDGLQPAATGDPGFDQAYAARCSGDDACALLTPALRASLLALHGNGKAGRPFVAIGHGRIAVLFRRDEDQVGFHVPPYWIPIDIDALLVRFASDLAQRRALITATLALPSGESTRA